MKKMIAVLVVIFVLFAVYLLKTDTGLTQKLLKPVVVISAVLSLKRQGCGKSVQHCLVKRKRISSKRKSVVAWVKMR